MKAAHAEHGVSEWVSVRILSLVAAVLLSVNLVNIQAASDQSGQPPVQRVATNDLANPLQSLGGYFIENRGQVDEGIGYYSMGNPSVAFRDDGVMFVLREESAESMERPPYVRDHLLRESVPVKSLAFLLRFEDANKVVPIGKDRLPFNSNFFIGNNPEKWRTDVPNYGELVYHNLYDGIDLIYSSDSRGVKYEFVVSPGIDAGTIKMRYEGIESLQVAEGGVVARTAIGEIRDSVPYSFQGGGQYIPCSFALRDPTSYGFSCPGRDMSEALTIDPLVYSTFLGGTGGTVGSAITADSSGNVYVVGMVGSADFNVTPGAYDTTYNGDDAFVTKLNAAGSALAFSTFLGGAAYEYGASVLLDSSGYVYVAGGTQSRDFPTTPGAFDESYNNIGPFGMDAFVTKLDPSGSSLIYSTFLGGDDWDAANSVDVDSAGCAYVTGLARSNNFPVTAGVRFPSHTGVGTHDAFVTKLNAAGSALAYSTFMGGTEEDYGGSISIDSSGNAYVTGTTTSTNFPTTAGAFQVAFNGSWDAFVAKFSPTANILVYSTFLGGARQDEGYSIAVDSSGNAYIAGTTHSLNFPNTTGAFDTTFNGGDPSFPYDAFVTKVNATGSELVYSTYLGGKGDERGESVAIDSAGRAYVVGFTSSGDFPTTPGAFDRSYGNVTDTFVTALDPTGGTLAYSTLLGGRGHDEGHGIAIASPSGAYVTGTTNSTEFPVTPGAFNPVYVGNPRNSSNAFITKVDMIPLPDLSISPSDLWTVPPSPVTIGAAIDIHVNVRNVGGANATNFMVVAFDDLNLNTQNDPGELIGTQSVGALRFGTLTELVFPLAPSSVGTHSLCGLADPPPGTVVESDETNNVGCTNMTVQIAPVTAPDYLPISPLPPSPTMVGLSMSLSLSVEVLNQGNATASTDTTLAFYNESSPASPFTSFKVNPVPPGGNSSRFTATWTSPATPGTYLVSVDVDHDNNVTEWDETNNLYTWTIEVVAGPITSVVIGNPNYTFTATYIKSTTPLGLSVVDQSGSGINYTKYRIDNVTWNDYTSSFFLAGEKDHYVEYYSEDNVGNVEDVNHKVLRVDNTPPVTNLLIGDPKYLVGGNFTTSSTPIALQATDGGTIPVGVGFTRYRIDGGDWRDYSSSFTLAGEGTHILEYYSRDLLTNEETVQSIQIVVDNSSPTSSLSIGDPKYLVGGNFTKSSTPLTLHADDGGLLPVGTNSTFYRLWNGTWSSWREYTSSFSLTGRDGTWFVEFLSFDFLGNMETVQNETLILDNTPPATMISPATGEFTTDTLFNLTAIDSGSGVNYTEYRVDGGTWTKYTASFTLSEGDHNITYRSVDNLGNLENEKYLNVTVSSPYVPPATEANYKPLVALVFAIILAIVGYWSSKRRPWKGGEDKMAVAKAFMTTSVPFVFAESLTGIVSFVTGELRIPPVIGIGTVIDSVILATGLGVTTFITIKARQSPKVTV